MERINVSDQSVSSIIVLSALAAQGKALVEDNFLNEPHEQFVDVELRINGIVVPFEATIQNIWRQCQALVHTDAQQLALQMVGSAKLQELAETIDRHASEIRDAFKRHGVDLDSD